MKKIFLINLLICFWLVVVAAPCLAKKVSLAEAETAAENWLSLIIYKKGSWGDSATAELESIREFKRGGRTIGYFAKIYPRGFIIISLRKELAPIKAYSAVSNLIPDLDVGLTDLIKGKMGRIITGIEKRLGTLEKIPSHALQNILEINYRSSWDKIMSIPGDINTADAEQTAGGEAEEDAAYQSGDFLLKSSWHQRDPYNEFTPDGSCTNTTNGNTLVGCVATAGAQVMRYWNWPPYGINPPVPLPQFQMVTDYYDWANMLDRVLTSSPQASINAVAELSYEVGRTIYMDYGCTKSSTETSNLVFAYENYFRYSGSAGTVNRSVAGVAYPASLWFDWMKVQLNQSRPINYRVYKHSIVADGWQELDVFNPVLKQYHMNYGWDNSKNAWYTLDALYYPAGGSIYNEYMLTNVFPAQSFLGSISGIYTKSNFPYYYFDRDTVGNSVRFDPGLNLQFLEGTKVTNASTIGGYIRFEGSGGDTTRMFSGGDTSTGVRIDNGTIKMRQNGSIKMY